MISSTVFAVDGVSSAYEKTSSMVMFCHALMMLEILHAALGLVRGSVVATFLQASQIDALEAGWLHPARFLNGSFPGSFPVTSVCACCIYVSRYLEGS